VALLAGHPSSCSAAGPDHHSDAAAPYVLGYHNGDGVFNRKDALSGTSLGLDLNNDGRIRGSNEYYRMGEIIAMCGRPMKVADLDLSGLSIAFRVSALTPPAVDDPVPSFVVPTTTGKTVRSQKKLYPFRKLVREHGIIPYAGRSNELSDVEHLLWELMNYRQ